MRPIRVMARVFIRAVFQALEGAFQGPIRSARTVFDRGAMKGV